MNFIEIRGVQNLLPYGNIAKNRKETRQYFEQFKCFYIFYQYPCFQYKIKYNIYNALKSFVLDLLSTKSLNFIVIKLSNNALYRMFHCELSVFIDTAIHFFIMVFNNTVLWSVKHRQTLHLLQCTMENQIFTFSIILCHYTLLASGQIGLF